MLDRQGTPHHQHGAASRGLLYKFAYCAVAILVAMALLWITENYRERLLKSQIKQQSLHLTHQLTLTDLLLQSLLSPKDRASVTILDNALFYQRYPAMVVGSGYQSVITLSERESLEGSLSYQLRNPFIIRDYRDWGSTTWQENGAWIPSPARQYYLPLMNLNPAQPLNRLHKLQGLDILSDPFLGEAALLAWQQPGTLIPSKPFTLPDGSPGVALLKADNRQGMAIAFLDMHRAIGLDEDLYSIRVAPANEYPSTTASRSGEHFIIETKSPYRLPYIFLASKKDLPTAQLIITALLLLVLLTSLFIALFHYRQSNSRRHANMQRNHSDSRESHLLKTLPTAVIHISERMQIRYANDAAREITRDETLVGKLLLGVDFGIFGSIDDKRINILHNLIEQQKSATLPPRSYLIDAQGKTQDVEGELIYLSDHGGVGPKGYLLSFRPLGPVRRGTDEELGKARAQLKKHQDELARIARINTLGEMSSGVAHEINQPLSAIMSYNEACLAMLDDHSPDPVLLRISLSSSVKQANRAGKIIRRLRELASRKQPVLSPLHVNELLSGSIAMVQNELDTKQIELTTDLASNLPMVMADNIQLEQVIINLIKNATDALLQDNTRATKRIFAYTELRGRHIRLGIRDNGPGMPENVLPHVFDPFYSSKNEGMGLGLTISQTIVESIGGKLAARNLETGGAEFALTLPAIREESDDFEE